MNYEETPRKVVELSKEEMAKLQGLTKELATVVYKIGQVLNKALNMPQQTTAPATGVIIDLGNGKGINLGEGCITITNKESGDKVSYQIPPGICCTGGCPCA